MKVFTIKDTALLRPIMLSVWEMVNKGIKGGPVEVVLRRPKRSLDQNAKLWPMLTDIASQVEWYGEYLTKEDWKDILTASLKKQKAVPGTEGGFVVLGARTSQMSKGEFSELIELIYAFGSERDVVWSEQAVTCYEQYRET